MHPHFVTVLSLGRDRSQNKGLSIEADGVYLGRTCRLVSLEKDHKGRTRAAVRRKNALDTLLSAAYDRPVDAVVIWDGLGKVAQAFEEGNLFKATLAATFLGLPELPDDLAVQRLLDADRILKANFNPEEPRDERGRWTIDGGGTVDTSRLSSTKPLSSVPDQLSTDSSHPSQEIAETMQERHNRCVEQCLHLLRSPSGDLQSSEYRKCYRECMGTLN
jgi:hypothetical protein